MNVEEKDAGCGRRNRTKLAQPGPAKARQSAASGSGAMHGRKKPKLGCLFTGAAVWLNPAWFQLGKSEPTIIRRGIQTVKMKIFGGIFLDEDYLRKNQSGTLLGNSENCEKWRSCQLTIWFLATLISSKNMYCWWKCSSEPLLSETIFTVWIHPRTFASTRKSFVGVYFFPIFEEISSRIFGNETSTEKYDSLIQMFLSISNFKKYLIQRRIFS